MAIIFISHYFNRIQKLNDFYLAMIPNQLPLIILKVSDNLVLMAITFMLLYVHFGPLFQDSVTCASFCFSFRSTNPQQDSCWTII